MFRRRLGSNMPCCRGHRFGADLPASEPGRVLESVTPIATTAARSGDEPRAPRVLEIAPRFAPYSGGVERHLAEIVPRLARLGLDVTVLTTDVSRALPEREVVDGVSVLRVPAYPAGRDYYFAPGLSRIIRERGAWDLVHIHSYQTFVAPVAMYAAHREGLPYLLTLHSGGHSSGMRNAVRGVQLMVLRPLLRQARRLIAVSAFEAEEFAKRLRLRSDRFAVIPNGGQMPTVAPHVVPDPAPLIVSVGRLERYKGHQRILAAMPHITSEFPSVRLRIVGEGPYEPELRHLAARLGMSDRVEIGPIPPERRDEMAEVLARASLVTLLSEYESQGIAIMEALALQRPVLVAYTSGLMEYADRGLARGVSLDAAPFDVAQASIGQLRDPLEAPAVSMPTWDGCAERLATLYRQTVGARSATG